MKLPTLSFCITCKDRLGDLKNTLRDNLDDNALQQDFIDFVLVDFGSNDGLIEWVREYFSEELETGYLKLFHTKELPVWHPSIARNTAAKCSTNDIIVNLDSDCLTGTFGGVRIINEFLGNKEIIYHEYNGIVGDRSFSKIAIYRYYFELLGGYDESLDLFEHQDTDLILRLLKYGLKYRNPYSLEFNEELMNPKEKIIPSKEAFEKYVRKLKSKSSNTILDGCLIVNQRVFGISKNIYDYKGLTIS